MAGISNAILSPPVQAPGDYQAAFEVTGTSATTVLTVTPGSDGLWRVLLNLSVVTAATTVTLSLTWTDPNTDAQTFDWYTAADVAVGNYPQLGATIMAKGGDAVTVTITAGTADQCWIGGALEPVR